MRLLRLSVRGRSATSVIRPRGRRAWWLAALAALGNFFPENYRTEVRTQLREFLAPLIRCLSSGLLLWPDYGFARPEYYHPDRRTGTLRTFSKHRAAENFHQGHQ